MRSTLEVYSTIREEIVYGRLNPGERLVERDLCERLETSRGYLREALKLLANDGFVILSHGRGGTVAKISIEETRDLYQILAALEAKSVELAVPNLRDEDLKALSDINQNMKMCVNSKDRVNAIKVWHGLNQQFHRVFAEKSGNVELKNMLESIRWRTFDFRYEYLFEPHYQNFFDQHADLLAVIQNKEFSKAKEAMENHVNKASEIILQCLERMQKLHGAYFRA